MAVFQAVWAFELFTGIEPDAERMLRHFAELAGRRDAMKRSIATVCLSGTLEEKLAAAAARRLRRRRDLRERPDRLAARPGEVRALAADLGLSIDLYQPFRDFDSTDAGQLARTAAAPTRKFDVMEALGADALLVCSNVSPDAVDDDALAAAQLHELAERAAARGIRIAYEALAWGRHVNDYEHAWRIVEAGAHPNLGTCLDSFHILSRGSDPARSARSPARRSSSSSSPTRRTS